MKAKYMDKSLKDYIDNKSKIDGKVAELSSHGFMVITENELVYFLTDEKYISPMSLVFEDMDLKKKVAINQEVLFRKNKIIIGFEEIEIRLDDVEILELNGLAIGEYVDREVLYERQMLIEKCIYSNGKHEGFAPIIFGVGDYIGQLQNFNKYIVHNNLYTSVAFLDVINFMEKIVDGQIDEIWKYSTDVIGFGPGVTPSSNDFICGFMNTLVYTSDYYDLNKTKVYRLNEELLLGINNDSDNLSQYMMRRSIYGKTQKSVIKVISYTISRVDREDYVNSIKDLIQFGDITGTDILCGIYFAFRALDCCEFREKLK